MSRPVPWERLRDELDRLLALEPAPREAALTLLAASEPELAAELGDLLAAATDASSLFERPVVERLLAPAATAEPPPRRIGPWQLEEEIGRGGMGTVWRARRDDGAYERTVAIKLVRAELSSELLRRHLARERRILARLVHPAIVPLLDGGTTENGTPYLVLEHVEGARIDAWCDARALPLAERLGLFVEVCGAVAFAHRQLVLHRDLKTANILVDAEGRVRLLDFGIARLLEADDGEGEWTALGLPRPLTPGWASPEQLRGEPLTTASDVYSLGVLLCVLTAGRPPHAVERTSSHAELATRIAAAGRVRLSAVAADCAAPGVDRRQLGGDLERIVAKALDPDPAERYPSVALLAEDVERFLAGRPVLAHPPALGYRLARFVRRHALAVAATTLATLLLVGSGVVSLLQAQRARREAERAARRLVEVRELAGQFLFDLETGLRELSGSTSLREQVVTTALRYLELLSAEAADDPALLDDLARGYVKVGEIQGSPHEPNLSQLDAAMVSAARAIDAATRLVELTPGSPLGHERRAYALRLRGDLEVVLGRASAARASFEEGLAEAQLAAEVDRADAVQFDRRRLAAGLHQRIAGVDQTLGKADEAVVSLAASLAEYERLAAIDAGRVDRSLLVAHALLGHALQVAGRGDEALVHHRKALEIADRRLAAAPNHPEARSDWTGVGDRLAAALVEQGDLVEARRIAERGLEVRRQIVASDPGDLEAAYDLAVGCYWVGLVAMEAGDLDAAAPAFEASVASLAPLTGAGARNVEHLQALVSARGQLGEVERMRGRRAVAHALFTQAARDLERLVALAPEGTDFEAQRRVFADSLAATAATAGSR